MFPEQAQGERGNNQQFLLKTKLRAHIPHLHIIYSGTVERGRKRRHTGEGSERVRERERERENKLNRKLDGNVKHFCEVGVGSVSPPANPDR